MKETDKILARRWAEKTGEKIVTNETAAAVRFIKENTSLPTMEDIGWMHEMHCLMAAETPYSSVIMLDEASPDEVWVFNYHQGVYRVAKSDLFPQARHYQIQEVSDVSQSGPTYLKDLGEYLCAPTGTVVASNTGDPWIKNARGDWSGVVFIESDKKMSEGVKRRVLRWGWGK